MTAFALDAHAASERVTTASHFISLLSDPRSAVVHRHVRQRYRQHVGAYGQSATCPQHRIDTGGQFRVRDSAMIDGSEFVISLSSHQIGRAHV